MEIYNTICKLDRQWKFAVWLRELEQRLCDRLKGGMEPLENGYPLQYSCLENSMDRGAWQSTVHRVAKSQT